jgi:hypothetical protein
MTRSDKERIALLRDPKSPRTPVHFKLLDVQPHHHGGLIMRDGYSARHRTSGYISGASVIPYKPISKMLDDPSAPTDE